MEGYDSLAYLKLDMEGSEGPILLDLVEECRRRRLCPWHVRYERLIVLKTEIGRKAAKMLVDGGYRIPIGPPVTRDCRYTSVGGADGLR
jgi:hypothetical protein